MSDKGKGKPALDEQTFSKLLEAAYVLQEHNREMQKSRSDGNRDPHAASDQKDRENLTQNSTPGPTSNEQITETEYGITLAKIVETQQDIQVRHLDLEDALTLVVNRLAEITKAKGATIGIVERNLIRYRAVAGKGTPTAGTADLLNKSLSAYCLKSGKAFGCGDVSADRSLDSEICKKRGIGSLIATPIFHNGRIVGGLELYYATSRTFTDQDVHTCRLMAGLVTEALARDEEITWKKSLADERAAMLEALEKLQPNLAALIEQPQEKAAPAAGTSATDLPSYICRKCGHELVRDEQFCGQCGTPRASDYEPPSTQSKVASLWHLRESQKKDVSSEAAQPKGENWKSSRESVSKEIALAHSIEEHVPEFLAPNSDDPTEHAGPASVLNDSGDFVDEEDQSAPGEGKEATEDVPESARSLAASQANHAQWSSALSARAFLEKLTPAKHRGTLLRLWNTHRGDIYLLIAVVLVAGVIRWGLWSNHSAKAKGTSTANSATHRKSPDSDLSFFDRMLIQLGLAEAPPPPEDRGNPGVQVWVDLQTALYYCPGADLYGKTPKGKFTTQRAAQLDQFEPAYRKACN